MPSQRPKPGERGQTLILFVLVLTVVLIIGVIVVDFGLWFSERRGAQKDADAAALAGAQAYLNDLSDTATAFNDAVAWAAMNEVPLDRIDDSPTSDCSARNSCIDVGTGGCRDAGDNMPWVEARIRHDAANLFTSLFASIANPDVGAVARACVGSPTGQSQLSPFGVQTNMIPPVGDPETGSQCQNSTDDDGDGTVNDGCPLSGCMEPDPDDPTRTRPIYGAVCILKTGAQDSVNGQRGQLTIGNVECDQTSANTLEHDFHYGTNALCYVGQQVHTGTGNILGLLRGLNDRLKEEVKCDRLFFTGHPGYDDFNEVFSLPGAQPGDAVVPSPDHAFSANDCAVTTGVNVPADPEGHVHTYLPRAIDLVLIDQLSPTNQTQGTATITGFAGFYVIGCFDDSIAEQKKAEIEQNLNNIGPHLNRCDKPGAKDDILGIFVKKVAPPVQVADPDPNLPLTIVLVK
jgi:Tfp pilus assembly protein PilX